MSNKWNSLGGTIKHRFKEPCARPEFIIYFLFFICLMGALGQWIELFQSNGGERFWISLATFALTLGSVSVADAQLSENKEVKYVKTLALLYIVFYIILVAFAILTFLRQGIVYFSVLSVLFGLILWWQVNSNNPSLDEDGKDAQNAIPDATQISGDEKIPDYKV